MANLNFNANEVQPDSPMEAIPAGQYKAEITESEMKPTKDGNGEYLELTLKITEGHFANRLMWDRLNLRNANPKAVEIAQRTLSAICHATGRLNITDSTQLHGIPMLVKVVVKDDPQYGPRNEIKGYSSAGVSTPPMGNGQPQPAQTGPAAAAHQQSSASHSNPPPWNRGAA